MPVTPTDGHLPLAFAVMPADTPKRAPSDLPAVQNAIDTISRSGTLAGGRQLSFLIDAATKRVVVQVIDTETREVVEQIPTDQVLQMAAALSHTNSDEIHLYG